MIDAVELAEAFHAAYPWWDANTARQVANDCVRSVDTATFELDWLTTRCAGDDSVATSYLAALLRPLCEDT